MSEALIVIIQEVALAINTTNYTKRNNTIFFRFCLLIETFLFFALLVIQREFIQITKL